MEPHDQYDWLLRPSGRLLQHPGSSPVGQPEWQYPSQLSVEPQNHGYGYNPPPTAIPNWAQLPPCPGSTLVRGWSWYGFDNLVICPQCWASFASSTPLAAMANLQNVPIAEPRMCCLYSPRMRAIWMEACARGDPTQVLAFSFARLNVYSSTVPTIEYLRHSLLLQRTQAMHLSQMSTMYQGMSGMQVIAGTTDGYLHGNDQLGWYRTDNGATSAQFAERERAAIARASDPGTLATIAQLEARWREVE
ncbi:hypothetical protein BR93DRAFT_325378 [Coniochaeta sp. PMI_546]|nr:hypothetical protein BR93DRAFT_325378 [Coniochaeta sp. PMI_546]